MVKVILTCERCDAKDERNLGIARRIILSLDEDGEGHMIFETNYAGYSKSFLLCVNCRRKVKELIGALIDMEVEKVKGFLENREKSK